MHGWHWHHATGAPRGELVPSIPPLEFLGIDGIDGIDDEITWIIPRIS
jgi:hypothetical protein